MKSIERVDSPTCQNPGCNNKVKFHGTKRGFGKFCSHSCSTSFRNKEAWRDPDYRNKMISIINSEESLEKKSKLFSTMNSENWKLEEYRVSKSLESSVRLKRLWTNKDFREMKSAHNAEIAKENWTKEEYRTKLSEHSRQNRFKNWGNEDYRQRMLPICRNTIFFNSKKTLKGYYSSKKAGIVHYRSSWELKAYKLLDSYEEVLSFKVENISIPYLFEDKDHLYFPDIYCNSTRGSYLIEVKPSDKISDPKNIAKFSEAKKYCLENNINFLVWDESIIFNQHTFLEIFK